MAPRGLSAEEKRTKLLEIFHETKDFYQLKELEKLGPKMKGIVSQSVKEVLQSLVDDGVVQADKIGSSNFFWSFPSQQGEMIQGRVLHVKSISESNQLQLIDIRATVDTERTARSESVTRTGALQTLLALNKRVLSLEDELATYGDCDPARVEEAKRAVFLAKEATFRWTDNYGMLLGYFTRLNGVEASEVRKFLNIGDDYEDIC
ncbi:meiotic nuclear division protein 1 [Collybia nuda]|uniref:Meiotic nuclear division protein 1 n=1 Tax=Collybia nuda TaxID=64659 RepID=A0A9P6CHT4_9AGAR|nr:meiotic nuclear division protein 1 [Collybia nuda]